MMARCRDRCRCCRSAYRGSMRARTAQNDDATDARYAHILRRAALRAYDVTCHAAMPRVSLYAMPVAMRCLPCRARYAICYATIAAALRRRLCRCLCCQLRYGAPAPYATHSAMPIFSQCRLMLFITPATPPLRQHVFSRLQRLHMSPPMPPLFAIDAAIYMLRFYAAVSSPTYAVAHSFDVTPSLLAA